MLLEKIQRGITKQLVRQAFRHGDLDLQNFYKHVAIFPESRLAYNRIKKNANTRIAAFLTDCLSNEQSSTIRNMRHSLVKPADLHYSEVLELETYFSIVFVRDPYSRVLSAFLDKLAEGRENLIKVYGNVPGFADNSHAGFLAFLHYLDAGGLRTNMHWRPQVELLYQPIAKFSFVGRLERTVADMRQILEAIGQDPELATALDRRHALEAGRVAAQTSASSRLSDYYTEECRDIVGRLYKADFEEFGYPT